MDSTSFKKKNGRYYFKYINSESFYKNSLLLECVQHFKYLMVGNLLDLGCGNKPYKEIYNEVCDSSVGCDVPFSLHKNSDVEVLCFAEDLDKHFKEGSFDCVLCTEVLEHTANDNKVLENINKILAKNGSLIISAPFTYVLHEAPYDFRRYTLYGLKDILERNGFKINSQFSMGGTFSSGFFIYYYAVTKLFYYAFKKVGLINLRRNSFLNAVLAFPEWVFYRFNISSFRKKLSANKSPSMNEMYSSLGYFITAERVRDE